MRPDLGAAPLNLLRVYPYPACVVYTLNVDHANGTASTLESPGKSRERLLEVVWSNDHWIESVGLVSEELRRITGEGDDFTLQLENPLHLVKSTLNPSLYILTATHPVRKTSNVPPAQPFPDVDVPPPFDPSSPSQRQYIIDYIRRHEFQDPPITAFPIGVTDCHTLLEQTDWDQTKIGPRASWSGALETMITTVMSSPTQDSLWLGEDSQMIYNDNYAQIVHHPRMFGRSAKSPEAWGPVWDSVTGLIEKCLLEGEACYREDDLLLYRKGPRGHYMEKYHTWSFIPIFDTDRRPLGMYNPTRETTAAVLARRRQETMRALSEQLLVSRTIPEYHEGVALVLETNPKDVPFLICYGCDEGEEDLILMLRSKVGVPDNHPMLPSTLTTPRIRPRRRGTLPSLDRLSSPSVASALTTSRVVHSKNNTSWPIVKALTTRQCVVVDCTELITDYPLREWQALPHSAIVIPICSETSFETPRAVLIMGLNVACPLDAEYEDWIYVMRAHLTSSLGSIIAYEAEQQRLLDIERLERAKTAWFQGAAHDLRSPLTLVAGPLDDVLRSNLSPPQRKALNLAQRNLSRVQRLVNALLDFSRIEAGKLAGRFVPTDLGRFVADLAGLFRPAFERRRLGYDVQIEPYEGVVFIDPTLLETVITNLISNALKYTESGRVTVKLSYGECAEIAVLDTGIGIPASELSAVTDRFNRATTALSRGTEGTGIGLALTKEIVRLHDGELLITSRVAEESNGSHGSTFTARIPLSPRDIVIDDMPRNLFGTYGQQVVDEAMHWGGHSEADSDSTADMDLNGRSDVFLFEKTDVLLLVDDNLDMRDYVKRIFTPYCTVIEASDGLQALEIAKRSPPDMILSDLMMPKMNGQQLLSAIRNDPTTKNIPMVLLSAATDEELRLSALLVGAEDFMLKPFKPKELLARVHLHMQLGKRRNLLEGLYTQRERETGVLVDYCPSGIVRADAQGRIIYCNDAWRGYCGLTGEEDPDEWPSCIPEETRAFQMDLWREIVHGEERETQVSWKWSNGKIVSGTFIRLDKVDPSLSGVLGCLSDISYQEEKLLEAERRRLEAEESKRQQELLVDLTSHEIRTPVSAILQCSSLAKENLLVLDRELRGIGDEGFRPSADVLHNLEQDIEALESIYQCGLVQERIANDVLSLARVQLDMLSFYDATTDLKKEAKKVVSVFASEAKTKNIELALEFGNSVDTLGISTIKTDHVRLGQVVTNLISNAIKFTATSKIRRITVTYDVSLRPPEDDTCATPTDFGNGEVVQEDTPVWLFVAIRDTGPGLGLAEQQALFKRFSQGNQKVHTEYGGSGLGLFICKKLSELLGGRIEMQSQLGVGSVFRFFIKTRTANPSILSIPSTNPSSPPLQIPYPVLRPLHVLIVEDNIINQTVLKRQIIKAGLTCDVADNGRYALDKLDEAQRAFASDGHGLYDVVLMDLEMPVMDGLTAVGEIRKREREGALSTQLVIALTGNARSAQIEDALEAGMDDVVVKPYKLGNLLEKMRLLVSTKGGVTPKA